MNTPQRKLAYGSLVVVMLCLAMEIASHAQAPQPSPLAHGPAQPSMDAERAQIWNSPNMLRARAWLLDFCEHSAKAKPGDAQKYMTELQNMTPAQMNLWLMKFDEEEAAKQQQQQFWQQAHQAGLAHAMAANRAAQQSLASISQEETAAANQEQGQLNEQQAAEQNLQADNQIEKGMYGPGADDGVHYHFHLYPY